MTPPRVVLDTNVLLDLWVFDDPGTRWLAAAIAARRVAALRTVAIDVELMDVLGRARFGLDPEVQQQILAAWQATSECAPAPPLAALICSDPDDQKFLDLALHARAALLFTRDRALLKLRRRAAPLGLAIARPASGLLEREVVDQDVA